jgi:hypothetical protein
VKGILLAAEINFILNKYEKDLFSAAILDLVVTRLFLLASAPSFNARRCLSNAFTHINFRISLACFVVVMIPFSTSCFTSFSNLFTSPP